MKKREGERRVVLKKDFFMVAEVSLNTKVCGCHPPNYPVGNGTVK